ncbi:MAG: hypothetical protein ABWY06_12065 [Pseudomonas sp.]|uniref:hypothetical protein n=1 Tax=Pseudomonas sp. TaxID=306 RepID=UPI0033993FC5
MGFVAEAIEEPVTRFPTEHEYARQRVTDSCKNMRFVNEVKGAVVYLISINSVLKGLDEVEGLLFFNSKPVIFSGSRYGGHLACEIKLEKISIPQELNQYDKEILEVLKEGLRCCVEWYKIAFWS